MKILLTGASGFVGKRVAKALVEENHQLVVLSRSRRRLTQEFPYPCEVVEWSDRKAPLPSNLFENVDGVIHLMGAPIFGRFWTKKYMQEIHDSRVETANILVQHALSTKASLRFWISASAIGFYGDRGDEWLNEKSSPGKDFLSEVCQKWENSATEASLTLSCRWAVVRIGLVLGDEGILKMLSPLFRLGLGGRLGSGRQWMSWIDGMDLARLFLYLVTREDLQGVFNGVSPDPVTNEEFTRQLVKKISPLKPLMGPPVPRFILNIFQGERAKVILASQRVAPERALDSGFTYRWPQLEKSLNHILA